jgi:hypothetical protein
MEISKKKLLSLIKENIDEMAMDFDTPDRPDSGIQDKLQTGETPFKKVPLPKTGDEPNKNFQELLASERYRQVIQTLREKTGVNTPLRTINDIMPLQAMLRDAHNNICQTELEHREQLEQLAIKMVMKELGVKQGQIEYSAKITGMDRVDASGFNRESNIPQQPNVPEVNLEVEENLMDDLAKLNMEKAKRRLINSMIQGSSKRGHYMYSYVQGEIRRITGSDSLINSYGIMMSINDTLYWQLSDKQMMSIMGGNGGEGEPNIGGVERIDRNSKPPKVTVEGINFPVIVHELIKGTMELIAALRGEPDDINLASKVRETEDTLEKEIWDLRLGPAIWDRVRNTIPAEILDDDAEKVIQLLLYTRIVERPAKEFLVFMREVISNTDIGKRLMKLLSDSMNKGIRNYDYEQTMKQFDFELDDLTKETDDNGLKDFLGGLGIDLSDTDDEE